MKYIYPFNSNGQPLSKRQTEIRAETKSKEDILDELWIDNKMLQKTISLALDNFVKRNPIKPNEDFLHDDADQTAVQNYEDRATEAVKKSVCNTLFGNGKQSREKQVKIYRSRCANAR